MTLQIRLFGPLTIEEDGQPSPLMQSKKGCALLAYLIVTRQPQRREAIGDLFWEAASTAQSLRNLRGLLHRIRPYHPPIQMRRTTLAFDPPPHCEVDWLTLTAALGQEDHAQPARLDEALRLYRGDLLDGFYLEDSPQFNEWLLLTQEQLRQRVMAAFEVVCEGYASQQRWSAGAEAARRWLALDDLDERAYRWLMTHLAGRGHVAQALDLYERCRQSLWEGLAVEPEAATVALADELAKQAEGEPQPLPLFQAEWPARDEMVAPGPLPPSSVLPFHRNQSFTGRREPLLQLADGLLPWPAVPAQDIPSRIAVTGMGGIGKSQLAVEFAYRYGRYFPGGVFLISLAEPDAVAEEVATMGSERGLGLFRDTDMLSLADQVGRVQRAWQESVPRLLIFDNCEDEALLQQWMPVTGGCRVLITSRRAQWSPVLDLITLPLSLLTERESIALLQHMVPRLADGEAGDLAATVGYLPLALYLVGSFLQRYPQITTEEYRRQLQAEGLLQHPSLQGQGIALSPTGRDVHVGRTFALGLARVKEDDEVDQVARQLLHAAACFAPGEPIPQALLRATAMGPGAGWQQTLIVEDGLARLVALGFLRAEGRVSVSLHRLLSTFVRETVAAEAQLAHAQLSVEQVLLDRLAPRLEQTDFQGELTVPIRHLRHVTGAALERSSPLAASLALALGHYLREVGEFPSAQAVLERGAALAGSQGDRYTQGRIMVILARVHYSQGLNKPSLQSAVDAERHLRRAGPHARGWQAAALIRQGWAHLLMGEADAALSAAETARQVSQQIGDEHELAGSLNLLAGLHFFLLNDYEAADRYYEEALALYRRAELIFNQATIYGNLAQSADSRGDYELAATYFQQALALLKEAGNEPRELLVRMYLSGIQVHLGQHDEAVSTLIDVTQRAPSDWIYAAAAYRALASGFLGQGRPDEALAATHTSLALIKETDDYLELGRGWRSLGLIAAHLDRAVPASADEEARYDAPTCFQRSIAFYNKRSMERQAATTQWQWARYELAHGDREKGNSLWQEAYATFERLNLPRMMARMEEERALERDASTE